MTTATKPQASAAAITDPKLDLGAAETAISRAEKVVDDLCARRIRWTMSVPAEPEHDPDLVISEALRQARVLLRASVACGHR